MAVSSAALPSMSVDSARNATDMLRERLAASQETIAVLVVPSMVAFLALGDVMIAMILEHGRFTHANTQFVWAVLAGSAVGLLATTVGRLYSSAFYALGDTRTPTWYAVIRVALVGVLGYALALPVPRWMGWPAEWGTVGLTVSAGLAGWVEFALLRSGLRHRLGPITLRLSVVGKAWAMAAIAAGMACLLRWVLPVDLRVLRGVVIVGVYGCTYLALAHAAGLMDSARLLRRLLRRRR
jgi:putative peptidoglycan lipid II flippase